MQRLEKYLRCLKCHSDLKLVESCFICQSCSEKYPIVDGIPRFVPSSYYELDNKAEDIVEKTKNYFGFEWEYFNDWGFIPDDSISQDKKNEYVGGLVSHRKKAFDAKCRLQPEELRDGKIVLDAGCGNGRYTFEAASRGDALVVGVDVGYGSVKSAHKNCKEKQNVIIIQASLFDLPFKNDVIDSCYSNGVLMHTGDAKKAFYEVSRTIKDDGTFVAHLYHKLNPIWEMNDYLIRLITTRLSIQANMKFASFLANFGKLIDKIPKGLVVANLFLRIQPTKTHMFDWYAAPIATHHTYEEVGHWFEDCGFTSADDFPSVGHIFKPWALNIKGRKQASSEDAQKTETDIHEHGVAV